jgi:pimeloyl-ACP methyl ester carboxylesterase
MFRTRIALPAAMALVALCAAAAPAGAAKIAVKGAPAPGPAKYDRVTVWTYGPSKAKTVLVLVPGTSGGAGSVAPVARDIAKRVDGLQVWAVDRREEAFEDQTVFRTGTLEEINAYYLDGTYEKPGEVPYVADWGLAVQTADLRRVVKRAADGGRRKVVLGGHSRGASQVAAYAAWDFNGRPGFRDLAGMVLIDGGLLGFIDEGTSQPYTRQSARDAVDEAREQPFNDVLGLGIPAIAQIVGQMLGTYALKDADALSQMQQEPLVPETLKPEFPVTNEAFFGYVFDNTYSPDSFRSLRTHSGVLAEAGDPRAWESGEQTPIERFAAAMGGVEPDLTEWYYPQRLIIDVGAANPMRRDPPSKELGLRLFHTAKIDTPLYAFETDLVPGRVLAGARRLIDRSKIRRRKLVRDHGMSHLDPVLAAPSANTFLTTVVPFLERIAAR